MAIWIIVSGIFAIIAVGFATNVLLPVLDGVYNDSYTQNLTGPAKQAADANYQIASMMAMLFMGGVFFAIYARAARKDRSEFLE